MKKILILILILGMTMVVGFSFPVKRSAGEVQTELPLLVKKEQSAKARPLYVPDEVIVKFKGGAAKASIEKLFKEQGVSEKYESKFAQFKVLKIPKAKTVPQLVEIFRKSPLIEYVEPNYYAYASMVPNDPLYSYQWHLDNPTYGGIQMEQAWDMETGEGNVVVAVVDTGVAYEDYPAPAHWHRDTYQAYGGSGNSWWCGLNEPAWVTEPGYGNGWKDYLQHSFNLTTATGTVTLTYQYRHDLEVTAGTAYDKAYTEVSTDNGLNWTILKTYTGKSKTGNQIVWKAESLGLTTYKGQDILLRFRFNSDDTYSDEDGYYDSDGALFIDEIKITHGGGTLFYDNVEGGAGTWETTKYIKAPDLVGTSFVAGYDFINNDTHANDDEGHGTHVAGTIAQTTNNNLGVAGVAFNTTIMPVKVLAASGSGTYQQVADGISYAANNGAKVISMSLGGSAASTVLENAVKDAYNKGVTVIAACGNSNTSSCDYPAAYNSYVIAVGATQYNETKAPYSSYGSSLDIVAPGGNTSVDQNGDGYPDGVLQNTFGDTPVDWAYWFYQGTSMATPHISGVAALLLARNSTFTPDQIRNTLQSTAEDKGTAGWDSTYGWGLVDAQAALENTPLTLVRSNFPANSWYMVSVPLIPQDSTPEAVFGDDLGNVFADWILGQWLPLEKRFKYHKASCCPWSQDPTSLLSVSPGASYWLISRLGPYNIDATGNLVANNDYYIRLKPTSPPAEGAWNQIGVPFNYSVDWSSSTIKVKNTATSQIVDLDTAQTNNWLENKIWWWDGSQYQFAIAPNGQLDPWSGYWVHNFVECDLIVTPTPLGGSSQAAESLLENSSLPLEALKQKGGKDWLTGQKGKSSPEWQIQLSVFANSQKDTYNFAGLKHKAKDDYDSWDVLEPPAISSGINLYFPHQDWSFNPGNFAQDIRKLDFQNKEWNFEIKSYLKNTPVTLKWSGLDQVKFYKLTLVDLEVNQTIDIDNTSEYTYNSGEGGIRHFKLEAKIGKNNSLTRIIE